MRNFIRHAGAFIGAFAVAFSAVSAYWILRFAVTLPGGDPARDALFTMVLTYPLRQSLLPAIGAALAFIALRRRLREWDVVTVSRTAIIGGLAGALWPVSMSAMMWMTRSVGLPPGGATKVVFALCCGGISTLALYFPWVGRREGTRTAELLAEAEPVTAGVGASRPVADRVR